MTVSINPTTISPPLGAYSNGILTQGNGKTLQIAGQVGVDAAGKLGATFAEQAELAWQNVIAILAAAGMGVQHLTKVNTYLTDMEHLKTLGPIRGKYLGDARPASTLIAVSQLVVPAWLIEIDAVAFLSD